MSEDVPTRPGCAAPVGTAESGGFSRLSNRSDRPDRKPKEAPAKNDDRSGLRAWLRALLPLDPVCGPADEAEERAAIESEACGEFGSPKPEAEHRAEVAALLLGFERHRHRLPFLQGDRQMCPAPSVTVVSHSRLPVVPRDRVT